MEEPKQERSGVPPAGSSIRFGPYRLDLRSAELLKNNRRIRLQEQPFLILVALLERPGEVVLREEIRNRLWPDDTIVEFDHGINAAVKRLRDALCDSVEKPRYIETLARKGYRFIGQVEANPSPQMDQSRRAAGDIPTVDSRLNTLTPVAAAPPPAAEKYLPAATRSATPIPGASLNPADRLRQPALVSLLGVGVVVAGFLLWRAGDRHHPLTTLAVPHLAVEQRITSHPPEVPIDSATFSPDGKYVAYADPTGLYLYDIANGETRPWPIPKDFVATPNSWFPDSTHLIVTRTEVRSGTQSLWKLSVLGGTPLRLKADAAAGVISPDGSRIAYMPMPATPDLSPSDILRQRSAHFSKELWLINADGTSPRRLTESYGSSTSDQERNIGPVVWSPHGQRIAYMEKHGLKKSDPIADSFALQTRDANGEDPQIIVSEPGLKPALCWFPDGRLMYAARADLSSERDDEELRFIQVDEGTGRAIGPPKTITRAPGRIGGMNADRSGKQLVLWRNNTEPQAFIVDYDAGSRNFNSLRRLTLDANGNLAEAWTPDSQAVLFVSNRNGTWKLFKQAINETTAEGLVQGRSLFLPRFAPDGMQVLYLAYSGLENASLPASIMRVPLAGGPPETILRTSQIINFQCANHFSQLCVLSRQVGARHDFLTFDMQGKQRALLTMDAVTDWSLSPDGSKLAVFLEGGHRIQVHALGTGKVEDLSVNDWVLKNGDWSADGKSLFMQSMRSDKTPVILEVNPLGKARVVLEGAPNTNFFWLIPSPDGRHAILEASVAGDNNLWLIDNLGGEPGTRGSGH